MSNNKLKELIKEEVSRFLKESMKDESVDKGTIVDTLASLRRQKALPHLRGPSGQKEFYHGYEQALKDAADRLMKLKPEDSIWAQDYSDDLRRESIRESRFPDTAEEYAKQINRNAEAGRTSPNDWISKLVTDPEHWASQGIHTGEELAHTLAADQYSDMYKDIHGVRPRFNWKEMSVDEIESKIDDLMRDQQDSSSYEDEPEETEYTDDPDFSFGTLKDLLRKDK